jgi:sugar phosphate isomerase/epimerase
MAPFISSENNNPSSAVQFRDRLVSSPVYFPHWPLKKVLSACRELGFSKFEGFTEWSASKLDWRGDPAISRQRAESMNLRFTSFHLPTVGHEIDEGLANALTAARFSAGLGANIVLFKAASLEIYARTIPRFLDALDEANLGLTPVLQNHFGTAISTLEDYKRALASVADDPRMKAILEVGHFQRAGVSWERGWDYLGDRVALIHLNEIRAGQSVLFGAGEVDFPGLMRRVKSSGYPGDMVVELELPNRESNPEETIDGVEQAVTVLETCYGEA